MPAAFRGWKEAGLAVHIFSSGSVLAQRLLFGHTDHGDLTGLLDGYHDTRTGPKQTLSSYIAIAREMGMAPEEVLFLSDVLAELDAARQAGMRTGLLRRPGHKPVEQHEHPIYETFDPLTG